MQVEKVESERGKKQGNGGRKGRGCILCVNWDEWRYLRGRGFLRSCFSNDGGRKQREI